MHFTGVEFDTIAREWRMKWSADQDKKSLAAVQVALTNIQPQLSTIPGEAAPPSCTLP